MYVEITGAITRDNSGQRGLVADSREHGCENQVPGKIMMPIGLRWLSWGRETYRRGPSYCLECGQGARFELKTRMRFFHILWIPLIPVSGKQQVYRCSNCRAAYDV